MAMEGDRFCVSSQEAWGLGHPPPSCAWQAPFSPEPGLLAPIFALDRCHGAFEIIKLGSSVLS